MSNKLKEPILLAGTGAMASAYAKVLRALEQPFFALGHSAKNASAFAKVWEIPTSSGDISEQLKKLDTVPHTAIVAVSALSLADVTLDLLKGGVTRILVEKPLAYSVEDLRKLEKLMQVKNAAIYIGYNRRFHASVEMARKIIADDGGVLSCKFDFTEHRKAIESGTPRPPAEFAGWLVGNSSHVIDLAFYLAGFPVSLQSSVTSSLPWHPSGAIYAGHGATDCGAVFSYHANWISAGRWGVEVMTKHRRLLLQPLEQLFIQEYGSFAVEQVTLDDRLDHEFKPGVYKQTQQFLDNSPSNMLLPISEHIDRLKVYSCISFGISF